MAMRSLDEIYCRNEKHYEKVKQTIEEGCDTISDKSKSHSKFRTGNGTCTVLKSKFSKIGTFELYKKKDEFYWTIQAILLAFTIFILSFNGAFYGRSEYSLLENGQTVKGSLPSDRAVVTLSIGYSAPYSILSFVAAMMLLYSVVSKKPSWSLPSIILSIADLVCDVGDALVAIWLFFNNLNLITAILYTVGTIVIILGEFWMWLGVIQLYEHRTP